MPPRHQGRRPVESSLVTPDEPSQAASRVGLPAWVGVYAAFLTVACAALCVLVLRLRASNTELFERAERAAARAAEEFLPTGAAFPPLTLVAHRDGPGAAVTLPDAAPRPLAFNDGRPGTIVVFISKSCHVCEEEMPYYQGLAMGLSVSGVEGVAIEVDATEPSSIHHAGIKELPVFAAERPEATWLRKIPMVPGVAIVGPDGVVRAAVFGTLDEAGRAKVESAVASLL